MHRGMDKKLKRTVISIEECQPEFDFEEAEHSPPFTFPEYQGRLLPSRVAAGVVDFAIVGLIYSIFVIATWFQMPEGLAIDKQIAGVYAVGFFVLVAVYFFLFMISASQTPGMKQRQLIAVTQDGAPLTPPHACMRGFGYLVSIVPLMLGFLWALIDPEHLTWADKVSGTYIKRI
jgi:uncharacterized RDD family membrane protein YckC